MSAAYGRDGSCSARRKLVHAKPLRRKEKPRSKAFNRDEGDAGDNCKKETRALGVKPKALMALSLSSPSSL